MDNLAWGIHFSTVQLHRSANLNTNGRIVYCYKMLLQQCLSVLDFTLLTEDLWFTTSRLSVWLGTLCVAIQQ